MKENSTSIENDKIKRQFSNSQNAREVVSSLHYHYYYMGTPIPIGLQTDHHPFLSLPLSCIPHILEKSSSLYLFA